MPKYPSSYTTAVFAFRASIAFWPISGRIFCSISPRASSKDFGLALFDQNQVIAEGCFNGFGDLPDGRFEHHFIELRHHLARAERAQIAAIFARAGIVGFDLG